MTIDRSHIETKFVQNEYEQLIQNHFDYENILVSYYGTLTQNVISDIETNVELKISSLGIEKGSLKRLFFVTIETLQNMLLHGSKTASGEQLVFFILSYSALSAQIICSNLVSNDLIPVIQKKISVINAFDNETELKAFYLEHLENNSITEKGGAGLGFITICMKSKNKLKADFKKIDNKMSLFFLTITIKLK